MRIANIVSPGDEHLQPRPEDVDHDVEVVTVVTRSSVMAFDPVLLSLRELVYVDAALKAEADGAAGVFINSAADWGVELVRAAVKIPVTAGGESGIAAALEKAANFSIVTVWPAVTGTYYERIMKRHGTTDRCVSMRFVLEEPEFMELGEQPVMTAMKDPRTEISQRVLRVAESAVRDDGAESIVLGCTCMAGLADSLSEALGVPVIDPLHEGFTQVAMAARAGASTGPGLDPQTLDWVSAAVDLWVASNPSVPMADCGDVCETLT